MFVNVTDWSDFTEPQISIQFYPVVKLAKHLFYVNCGGGAKQLADYISSAICKIDRLSAAEVTPSDVEMYFDLIAALEEDTKTSDQGRLTIFVAFFPKLKPLVQCRLVLYLERKGCPIGIGCQRMFGGIYHSLLDCYLRASIENTTVLDILLCYVRLGNDQLLNRLSANISLRQPVQFSSIGKQSILVKLISSPAIWEWQTQWNL